MNMHTPTLDEAINTNANRQRAKRAHIMNVMDRTGHTSVEWDPDDAVAVKAAKAKFDDYKRQGYQAFALETSDDGGVTVEEKGRRLDAFDETIGKIMMIPQLRGG